MIGLRSASNKKYRLFFRTDPCREVTHYSKRDFSFGNAKRYSQHFQLMPENDNPRSCDFTGQCKSSLKETLQKIGLKLQHSITLFWSGSEFCILSCKLLHVLALSQAQKIFQSVSSCFCTYSLSRLPKQLRWLKMPSYMSVLLLIA